MQTMEREVFQKSCNYASVCTGFAEKPYKFVDRDVIINIDSLQQMLDTVANKAAANAVRLYGYQNIDNLIDVVSISERENDMAKRMRHCVDINGRKQWISGTTQQELCEDYLKKSNLHSDKIEAVKKKETPFAAYALKWYETYHLAKVSEGTAKNTKSLIMKHLVPFFADKDVATIATDDIQTFFNTKKGLSESTCDKMFIYLNAIFCRAKKDKIIIENPCDDDDISYSKKKTKRRALEADDALDIEKHLEIIQGIDRLEVAIPFYLGMRRGEFLGLRWEDVDFENHQVRVERAIKFTGKTGNQPIIGRTKNGDTRYLPLVPELEAYMRPLRKETGFIFEGDSKPTYADDYDGTRFDSSSKPKTERMYRNDMKRIQKQIDLHGATAHVMRHTFCTAALESGIDIKTVQGLMGHRTSDMTTDVYADIDQRRVANAGMRISGMYSRNCTIN